MKKRNKRCFKVIAYIFCAFMTFGWVHNTLDSDLVSTAKHPEVERMVASIFAGVGWPIYWGCVGGIVVTKYIIKKVSKDEIQP